MSRARSINIGGIEVWFDTNLDGTPATTQQIEMLADVQGVEIDDLLDANLNQGQVILALRQAIDGNVIPPEVLERKRARKARAQVQPRCRICEVQGKSTRHHFVPRWIMRELANYDAYSARSICCIPLCVGCHRALHETNDADKSIIPYLRPHEAHLAIRMIHDLREQHPKIFDLIAGGDKSTYEGTLFRDYLDGSLARLAAGDESRSRITEHDEEHMYMLLVPQEQG